MAPTRSAAARERQAVTGRLRDALRRGRLGVHYQPVVDLHTGRFGAVEALLRLPEGTAADVETAIHAAERSDLIVRLGEWVLHAAVSDHGGLRASAGPLGLAVNVSTRQLVHADFLDALLALVEGAGLEPAGLCLEVTETALADHVEPVVERLSRLRDLGFRLAIDDFGTGHASLTYLARFPVHVVKVDRSFVVGLGADEASGIIVRSVVAMAHALGMTVTAEGVETLSQLEFVLDAGCDAAQGYLFAPPVEPGRCAELLTGSVPWPVTLSGRRSRPDQARPALLVDPARRYRLLLELARDVAGRLRLDDVLRTTFVALHQLVDFDGGSIQLVDGGFIGLAAADPQPTGEALRARIPLGQGVGGRIAVTGEPRYLGDITADADVPAQRLAQSVSGGVRSYFGVPLIADGAIIGVLQIDSAHVDAFSEEDRFTVLAFAPLVAAAVHNAQAFARHTTAPLPRDGRHERAPLGGPQRPGAPA